jgi:hypothetical protein
MSDFTALFWIIEVFMIEIWQDHLSLDHHRSYGMQEYDDSIPGAYYFIIATYDHESLFVTMPNHVHGIIHILDSTQNNDRDAASLLPYTKRNLTPTSLGPIIRLSKSAVTYRINKLRGDTLPPIWHHDHYDHIIRNEKEYRDIWRNTENNPVEWNSNQFDPTPDFLSLKSHSSRL